MSGSTLLAQLRLSGGITYPHLKFIVVTIIHPHPSLGHRSPVARFIPLADPALPSPTVTHSLRSCAR